MQVQTSLQPVQKQETTSMAQGSRVKIKSWAKSTESKVVTFLDDYLINFPVDTVRESTKSLLKSLYKKGTVEQKEKLLTLLEERLFRIEGMGKSAKEFLSLVSEILQGNSDEISQSHKGKLLTLALDKCSQTMSELSKNGNYEFYASVRNCPFFTQPLSPYLVEFNCCMKCFGKPEVTWEQKQLPSFALEIRAEITQVEVVMNRVYAIKDLKINFGKRKIPYRTVSIFYINENDQKKQFGGKFTAQQTLPTIELEGCKSLIFDFECQKSKRNQIACTLCGNNSEEYCIVCSSCFQSNVDISGNFKVIGADDKKLEKELSQAYHTLLEGKQKLKAINSEPETVERVNFASPTITEEMESTYKTLMVNMQHLQKSHSNQKDGQIEEELSQRKDDCFSCKIIEMECLIAFFKNYFSESYNASCTKSPIGLCVEDLNAMVLKFNVVAQSNRLMEFKDGINQIVATLILLKAQASQSQIQYEKELRPDSSQGISSENEPGILYRIVKAVQTKQLTLKETEQVEFDWGLLAEFMNRSSSMQKWNPQIKLKLFAAFFIQNELFSILDSKESIPKEELKDITRIQPEEYQKLSEMVRSCKIPELLQKSITNEMKIFLSLIPEAEIPYFDLSVKDPEYLDYLKDRAPEITTELIHQNLLNAPLPTLKLNCFQTFPKLIQKLKLEEAMKLITNLCRYKQFWNLNIKLTLSEFKKMLQKEDPERKLLLCLEGYQLSKESIYLEMIYEILVPQRMKFIIRMDVPEADMQKEERSREGGPIEYIFLPIREVRSEDLNGDTMRALADWVSEQLKKMNQCLPFDLIVDKYIIDNLDLPIEVVYKKIAQKEVKKSVGKSQCDFMRVIYRMQGFFGDANESASSNPRDEKLESCINYSSYLLSKIGSIQMTGLDVLMQIIEKMRKSRDDVSVREKMFRILQVICMNTATIKRFIEVEEYADLIINFTIKFFSLEPSEIKYSEVLLDICSKVIKEANEEMVNLRKRSFADSSATAFRKHSEAMELEGEEEATSESEKTVKYLLEKVNRCEDKDRRDLGEKLITLIPFCSKDEYQTSKYLFDYFQLSEMSVTNIKNKRKLSWFLQFIEILSESYTSFKIYCRENKFTDEVIANIVANLEGFKNIEDKKPIKNVQSLELSLTMIKGLIRGDEIMQKNLFDQQIVHELYRISKMSGPELSKKGIKVGKILTTAYEITKYFKEGRIVHPEVSEYIKSVEADKAKTNTEKKKNKLLMMKMKNNKIAEKYENEFKSEEEEALTCSSCRQGYAKRSEIIGIYIYSFRVESTSIEGWWKDLRKTSGLTSVSYFTPIHYECHMRAYEADQKIQKSEWQGALVRNSDVKCNGWIGIKGPKTTDDQFDKVNKKYFDKNNKPSNLGSGFWIVLTDLNGLLQKFSCEYNFSQETKGSSSTHNCRLVLVLIQNTAHLMKKCEEFKYLEQGVKYIEEQMPKRGSLINLYFCVLLFCSSYDDYQKKREKHLKLIDSLECPNFEEKKKYYVYLALINEIFSLIHVTLKSEEKVHLYLDRFIPQNLGTLIPAFQRISDKYKNQFIKWGSSESAVEYFKGK